MTNQTSDNNKRIAKNTLLLYVRMILIMIISLFTSRVNLQSLGVEDFGIYNVVGGVVAMFSVISGTLATAISRFITFELGRNNDKKINIVFSTSVTIQLFLAVFIVIIAEIVGILIIALKQYRLYHSNDTASLAWLQVSLFTWLAIPVKRLIGTWS